MEFGFTEEQEALRGSVREVLAERGGPSAFRRVMETPEGFDPALWKTVASLGWPGVAISESEGGLGLGLVECAIVCEEAGYGLLPAPFLPTVIAAVAVQAAEDPGPAGRDLLGRIARGEAIATLALAEPQGRWEAAGVGATAARAEDGWRLAGTKAFVPDAQVADEIVVVARTGDSPVPEEGLCIFLVPREALREPVEPRESLEPTRRLCVVPLDGTEVPEERLVGEPAEAYPAVARAIDRAALAVAAETVGVCQRILEAGVAYAGEREQFGRPIGSFQAVSHRIADQMVAIESARSAVYYAAWALEEATPDAPLATATAKTAAGRAASVVATGGIQVHGGIGFTWEHDMHLYYRRAKWGELFLGDTSWWRQRVASLLVAEAPAAS